MKKITLLEILIKFPLITYSSFSLEKKLPVFVTRFATVYLLANLGTPLNWYTYNDAEGRYYTEVIAYYGFATVSLAIVKKTAGQGKDIAKSLFFLAEDNIKTFTFQTIRWTEPGIAGLCGCEIISNNKITLKMITGTYSGDSIVKIIGFLK